MIQNQLAKKLLKNKIIKNIYFSNPEEFYLENIQYWYSICKLETQHNEHSIGYGVSRKLEVAKLKSFMEAVERLTTKDKLFHGSACYWFSALAKWHAKLEMIERDTWLKFLIFNYPVVHCISKKEIQILEVPSFHKDIFVYFSFYKNYLCTPYGVGASYNKNMALDHSLCELVLSLIRHKYKDCSSDNTMYGVLHQRTIKAEFKDKTSLNHFNCYDCKNLEIKNAVSHFEILSNCCSWPISVATVSSSAYLRWDLNWLLDPNIEHHNNTILDHYKIKPNPNLLAIG
ncbi:MAG: hypothetical protein HY843_01680 [Bdellovibrio sp.]|nr:hypothetical protein [Bdellovibrio sp.]